MKTLGLTGGIGSGKSTVARRLAERGARVVYADDLAKQLMHDDPALRAALVDAFGPRTYDAEGHLNRAWLAQQVFGQPDHLQRLNALVHPRVREAMHAALRQVERDGVPLLVYEAALLFETGADRHLDATVVVDAPLEIRIARVMARDGVPRQQVLARIQHQTDAAVLRHRADFVIENDGTPEELEAQIDHMFHALALRLP